MARKGGKGNGGRKLAGAKRQQGQARSDVADKWADLPGRAEEAAAAMEGFPTKVSNDRGLASLGVPSTPCVLCGGPVVGMGHNPAPLAEGRCCDACNTAAVIPARLGQLPSATDQAEWEADVDAIAAERGNVPDWQRRVVRAEGPDNAGASDRYGAAQRYGAEHPTFTQAGTPWPQPRDGTPGQRMAQTSTAYQGDAPGALQPGAGTGPLPEAEPEPIPVVRWAPTLGPGRITHAAAVPEFRAWLVRQWQPGGGFAQAAKAMADSPRGRALHKAGVEQLATDADVERRTLQRASLYYVEAPMVALLASCAPSCPPDVRPVDLVSAADEGLAVLAEPIAGTAADTGSPVETWAFTWSRTSLRASTLPGDAELIARYGPRVPCLSVATYRLVDFDRGLQGGELNTAALMIAGLNAEEIAPNGEPVAIHGTLWTPMGRSDWPIGDTLDADVPWSLDPAMSASIREDRGLIAAMFTLLAEEHVASQVTTSAPRASIRRLTRAGVTAPDAGKVVVVNLRRPKVARPEHPEGDHAPRARTHSWLVREHLRWQPCGPRRAERRLTVVRAHTRGQGPLVLKQKVQRWVR